MKGMDTTMTERLVNWERDGAVAIMTLNNPPVNQYSEKAFQDTLDCLEELRWDGGIKVVVFTASGQKVFIGGADIKSFPNYMKNYGGSASRLTQLSHAVFNAIAQFPKPVIAALNGHTFGGGLEAAISCDMRVASPAIQLGLPEITLGLLPGGGGTQRLPRLIGYGRAMQMLLTGESIDATEAQRIGLVNLVAPSAEETLDTAKKLANRVASFSSDSMCLIKKAAYQGAMGDMQDGLAFEQECFWQVVKTPGAREGVSAFLEKRKANFNKL